MKGLVWKLISFFGIQIALGRRGSFPYGLLINFSLIQISILVFISDIIQTILLLNFFNFFINRLTWVKKLKEKLRKKRPPSNINKKQKFKKIGKWGLLLVSALPYAGGALSGSLLAVSLKMDKKKALFIIILGCLIGTCLYYLAFSGIISILK